MGNHFIKLINKSNTRYVYYFFGLKNQVLADGRIECGEMLSIEIAESVNQVILLIQPDQNLTILDCFITAQVDSEVIIKESFIQHFAYEEWQLTDLSRVILKNLKFGGLIEILDSTIHQDSSRLVQCGLQFRERANWSIVASENGITIKNAHSGEYLKAIDFLIDSKHESQSQGEILTGTNQLPNEGGYWSFYCIRRNIFEIKNVSHSGVLYASQIRQTKLGEKIFLSKPQEQIRSAGKWVLFQEDLRPIIERAYRQILEREADPAGLRKYQDFLLTKTVQDMIECLGNSEEHQEKFMKNPQDGVINCYKHFLARLPENKSVLASQIELLKMYGNDIFINGLLKSKEYLRKFGLYLIPSKIHD